MRNWTALKKEYDKYVKQELELIKAAYDTRFEYLRRHCTKHHIFKHEFKVRRDKIKDVKINCIEVKHE